MKYIPGPVLFFLSVVGYSLFCSMMLDVLAKFMSHEHAAEVVGVFFVVGWFFVITFILQAEERREGRLKKINFRNTLIEGWSFFLFWAKYMAALAAVSYIIFLCENIVDTSR